MSSSTHQIKIKAVDKTAGAFSSIRKGAASAAGSIKSMLGPALAAAGAYLGAKSIMSGINELGNLSDTAQRASVSVDELTRASTAMQILGIKGMGVDQLATALQKMEKATGETGLQGMYNVIHAIGQLPSEADRANEAMKVFGDAGLNMIPLINAADTSTNALKDVVDAMPGVSQAAADAGDGAADAMAIAGSGMKSLWLDSIGYVVRLFTGDMKKDIRSAMTEIVTDVTYKVKSMVLSIQKAWRTITNFSERVGGALGSGISTFLREGIGGAFDKIKGAANGVWKSIGGERIEAAIKSLDSGLVDAFGSIASGDFKGALLNVSNGVTGAANKLVTDNIKNLASSLAKGDFKGALEGVKGVLYKDLNDAVIGVWDNVKGGAVGAWDSLSSGAKNAWNNAKNDWESTRIGQEELETKRDEEDRKRRQRWDEERKKQIEAAKKLSEAYRNATQTSSERKKRDIKLGRQAGTGGKSDKLGRQAGTGGKSDLGTSTKQSQSISNSLILAGSSEALKLSILGPQTTELKKVNNTLDKIKNSSEQTARNTKKNDTTGITVKPL